MQIDNFQPKQAIKYYIGLHVHVYDYNYFWVLAETMSTYCDTYSISSHSASASRGLGMQRSWLKALRICWKKSNIGLNAE